MILLTIVIILLILYFYFYATRNHDYWAKRHIKHDKPLLLFGNNFRNQFGIRSNTEISTELYRKYPEEKVVGYYRGTTPELVIRDLNIVRRVLTVDFAYFYPRGITRNPAVEPIFANVFHSDGDLWKLLRQRLTPAFTIAKLKGMFPLVVRCAEKLQDAGERMVARGGECDVRDLMARFTTDFIGACGFGIEMDTINDEHSAFRKLGKLFTKQSVKVFILLILWELFPLLRSFLYAGDRRLEEGFKEILQGIRKKRNNMPSSRNDYIDLLLELEAKGKIEGDSIEKLNPDGTPVQTEMEMDMKCMIGQVFIFFAAGFETSSSATSYTLHELAYNPEIQEKIQEEIDQVLMKYDNKLCYDAIAEMSLLSMAFKEAIRIFPSPGLLNRVCAKRYTIPELDITIDPGVKIVIPLKAIQNDENYFDNPKEFRPERFAPESVKEHHKYAYMPFGAGPRACIGARLGEMESLVGLAAIMQKFSVEPAPSSRRQLEIDHTMNFIQVVKGGLPLKLKLRKN